MAAAFQSLPGWTLASLGAYFAYAQHPSSTKSSAELAEQLTADLGVTCLPGSAFGPGQDAFIRFAFANTDLPEISQLASRLARITS